MDCANSNFAHNIYTALMNIDTYSITIYVRQYYIHTVAATTNTL